MHEQCVTDNTDSTTTNDARKEEEIKTTERTSQRKSNVGGLSNAEEFQTVVAQVSHDLRNQLNVACGRLDVTRQETNDDNLVRVATALDRMTTLVEDLQASAAAGAEIVEFERVQLPKLVDQCWHNVAADAAALDNGSTLELQADPDGLRRVLENLFRNAIEHNDTEVRVKVGDLDGGFYVADDGSGVPKHICDTVFTPGISTARDGSGLGLSIVARIVESHDWHIRVTESEVGGARFEITGIGATAT